MAQTPKRLRHPFHLKFYFFLFIFDHLINVPAIDKFSKLFAFLRNILHGRRQNTPKIEREIVSSTLQLERLKLLSKNGNWFNHIVSMWRNNDTLFYYCFIICSNSKWIKLQMKFTHPWTLVKRQKKVLISRSINHLRLICFIASLE